MLRCIEHTINLAAGDFVKALGPKFSGKSQSVESDTDIDCIDAWDDVPPEDENDIESVVDTTDFDAGDVLGKGLGLVNQVRLLLIFVYLNSEI